MMSILILPTTSTHVKAIESSPPPAPASACATLSLCCAATACPAGDPNGAFCACACGWVEAGSGFEGVGAATLSDMFAMFCWLEGYRWKLKRMLDYDSVFEVIYGVKERDRRLQMAALRVVVVVVFGWFGRGSRLLVIARMMPRQSKTLHWSRACDATGDPGGACLLDRAKAVLSVAGKGRARRGAFWGSFACIFLLIPLFRPTSIPFYTLSTRLQAQILANCQIRRRNIS